MQLNTKKYIKNVLFKILKAVRPLLAADNPISFMLLYVLYAISYKINAVDKYYFTSSRYISSIMNSGKVFSEYSLLTRILYAFSSKRMLTLALDASYHLGRRDVALTMLEKSKRLNGVDIAFEKLFLTFQSPNTSDKDVIESFAEITKCALELYPIKEKPQFKDTKSSKKSILYLSECYSQEKMEILHFLKYHDFKNYDVMIYSKHYPHDLARQVPELKIIESLDEVKNSQFDYLFDSNAYMLKDLDIYKLGRVAKAQFSIFNDLLGPTSPYIDAVFTYDYLTKSLERDKFTYIPMPDISSLNIMFTPLCDLPTKLAMEGNGYLTFGVPSGVEKVNMISVSAWVELLKTHPVSRIVFFHKSYYFKELRDYVLSMFKSENIDPARVIFIYEYDHYINVFKDIDIHLSTYPIPGGRTVLQSFATGFYSINLQKNDSVYSRLSGLRCSAIGREDLIASDQDELLTIVNKHSNSEYIKETRLSIRNFIQDFNEKSPDYFTRALEERLKEF